MAQHIEELSYSIRDILAGVTWEGNVFKLTCGQLERADYDLVNEVLTRLGGKWKGGKTQGHVFADQYPSDVADALKEVIDSGLMPPKNPLAYFYSPPEVCERLIEMLRANMDVISPGMRFLEPSAGRGHLARALRTYLEDNGFQVLALPPYHEWVTEDGQGVLLHVCELDETRANRLKEDGFYLALHDFLEYVPALPYHGIVLNPPFSVDGNKNAYIEHIKHAYDLLAPDGVLVALAPDGFAFRQIQAIKAFRELVEEHGRWEKLPEGSFNESGTQVRTCILTMKKPSEAPQFLSLSVGGGPYYLSRDEAEMLTVAYTELVDLSIACSPVIPCACDLHTLRTATASPNYGGTKYTVTYRSDDPRFSTDIVDAWSVTVMRARFLVWNKYLQLYLDCLRGLDRDSIISTIFGGSLYQPPPHLLGELRKGWRDDLERLDAEVASGAVAASPKELVLKQLRALTQSEREKPEPPAVSEPQVSKQPVPLPMGHLILFPHPTLAALAGAARRNGGIIDLRLKRDSQLAKHFGKDYRHVPGTLSPKEVETITWTLTHGYSIILLLGSASTEDIVRLIRAKLPLVVVEEPTREQTA